MQLKLNELLVWNIVLQKDINMSCLLKALLSMCLTLKFCQQLVISLRFAKDLLLTCTKMMHFAIFLKKVRIRQSYDVDLLK